MHVKSFAKLIFAVAICELAGVIGSVFTISAITDPSTGSGQAWYAGLAKPALNPPSWVFGPVWTTLYALMGIALFLVWSSYAPTDAEAMAGKKATEDKKKQIKMALGIFGLQLFLNAIWSIIFFGLHSPGWALVDIAALWLAIVWTMIVFYKISPPSSSWRTTEGHGKLAAYLLVPYLLWVSFATYLNYAIWTLN